MLAGQKITVLGAGIGGLAAATALAMRGADVRVLEQADSIQEVGAGLQISPNGVCILDALGLGAQARARAVRSHGVRLKDGLSGRNVLHLDFDNPPRDDPFLMFHRADLVDLLAHGARQAGVNIVTGARVEQVVPLDRGARIDIAGQGGEEVDFLVGADGLHSVLRPALNGTRQPFFTHQVAWRTLIRATGAEPHEATVYMGPGCHLVAYPLRGGEIINIVAVQERRTWADEGWFHQDDPENLRAAFRAMGDEVQALLARVDQVHLWGLFRHPVALEWHKGRTALLGDAAHPTLPFMAQGAVMALEDAWVLADCLEKMGLEDGPALYQARRRSRVVRVIEAANKNARNYHYSNPLLRFAGHNALRVAGLLAPGRVLDRFDWIYSHDVTKG